MFSNRISAMLHEEHRATTGIMERLEALLGAHRRGPPPAGDHAVSSVLRDVATGIEAEIRRHFDFEEQHLFVYLASAGDEAIGNHLSSEHAAMRPLGDRLTALARAAAATGFDEPGWTEFRRVGLELSERMLTHVQKEEMALLPLIEEIMDADTEERLCGIYGADG